MKKLLIIIAALFLPLTAFATPVSWDAAGTILQPLNALKLFEVKGNFFTGTSTTATSSFPILSAGSRFLGANLSDCDSASSALTWNISTWQFGCNSISGGGASFGQGWEIGGNGNPGFLAPTTTQKVWIGQASSTLFSATYAQIGGTATTTFTTAGQIGIGSTTPGTFLSIGDTGANTINLTPTGTSTYGSGINIRTGCFAINGTCVGGGAGGGGSPGGSGTELQYRVNASTFGAVGSAYDATLGALGIGTTTFTTANPSLLVLASTTAPQLSLSGGAGFPSYRFRNVGGNLYIGTSSDLTGATSTTPHISFLQNGKIGLGTSTPAAQLSVNAPGGTAPYFLIGSSTGTAVSVAPAGAPKLGIGTSSPFTTLAVSGDTFLDNATALALQVGTFGTTSLAFQVNNTTPGTGLVVTSAVPGGGVALTALSPGTNEILTLSSKGSGNINIAGGSGGTVAIQPAGVTRAFFTAAQLSLTPNGRATAAATPFIAYTSGTGAALTASTESTQIDWNLTASQSHASGAITQDRAFRVRAPSHTFTAGTSNANSTIASSTTFHIDGGPTQGANANYTIAQALYVGQSTYSVASTTKAYGVFVESPLGAQRNYGGAFMGSLGVGTSTPDYALTISSSTAPQLALTDASLTSTPWTFRSINNSLFIGTSSPTTFATSTFAALSITPGGQLSTLEAVSATSSAMTIDWHNTPNQVDIQLGSGATTIGFNNASTAGMTKRIIVCNPNGTAGAVTWSVSGLLWPGSTVPTQTTTGNKCDYYSFSVSQATSTSKATTKIFGGSSLNY